MTHFSTETKQHASSRRSNVAVTARPKAGPCAPPAASTMRSPARARGTAPHGRVNFAQPVVKKASIIVERGHPWGMPLFLTCAGPTWLGT
eukprot:3461821-Alexandrium_andersonii.AAC.1